MPIAIFSQPIDKQKMKLNNKKYAYATTKSSFLKQTACRIPTP